ncbi:MAG: hypothetical protein GC166_02610 [Alphaproteobacteria bacterium]|nr:hypothetical protein [Alphaproteobacteria bacterium]
MNLAYIRHHLRAALEMARFRGDPMAQFDTTYEGFFRSFWAMAVAAPLMPLIVIGERAMATSAAAMKAIPDAAGPLPLTAGYLTFEVASFVLGWLVFPLAMIPIARMLGIGQRYVPYVVAYNWGACIGIGLSAITSLMFLSGLVPMEVLSFIFLGILIFSLAYLWRIAHIALQIGGVMAAGIVLLDIVLSQFVSIATEMLERM